MDIKDLVNASTEEKLAYLRGLVEASSWDNDCREVYIRLLDDPSPEVRQACLAGLWYVADDADIAQLMEIASNDPDAGVRAQACSTLGIYVYEGAALEELADETYAKLRAFLLEKFRDESEDVSVRRFALESLAFEGEDEIAEALVWAYEQPDPAWRASAVFGMGRSGKEMWDEYIVKALKAPEEEVRLAAVRAASEGCCEAATPVLRNLAVSGRGDLRLEAIWALGRTGGPGALETLQMCAASSDQEVSDVADEAIKEYHMLVGAMEDLDDEEFKQWMEDEEGLYEELDDEDEDWFGDSEFEDDDETPPWLRGE